MPKKQNKKQYDNYCCGAPVKNASDVLGIVYFALSMAALYLAFVVYQAAVILSPMLLVLSIAQYFKNKTLSALSAVTASALAFAVSLFILLVNILVY